MIVNYEDSLPNSFRTYGGFCEKAVDRGVGSEFLGIFFLKNKAF